MVYVFMPKHQPRELLLTFLRFFRWIARGLATKLRSLDTKPQTQQPQQQPQPQTPLSPTPEEKEEDSSSTVDDDSKKNEKLLRPTNSFTSSAASGTLRSTSSQSKLGKSPSRSSKGSVKPNEEKSQNANENEEGLQDKFGLDPKEPLFKVSQILALSYSHLASLLYVESYVKENRNSLFV